MSRTTRGVLPDAQVRALSNERILEFLGRARQGLASAEAGEAATYAGAVASLELEATRRGLRPAGPHERMPVERVIERLGRSQASNPRGGWTRLIGELLDLAGLWAVYGWACAHVPQEELTAALEHIALALDEKVYGGAAAWERQRRYALLPVAGGVRLLALRSVVRSTFDTVFGLAAEEDDEG